VKHGAFDYFSGVCWFFGKTVYLGLNKTVPVGLISNNWGGTMIEEWIPQSDELPCHTWSAPTTAILYNAMITPYTVGPMAMTGFTWYQGEANVRGDPEAPDANCNYTCLQNNLIQRWRSDFKQPEAFFGVVQLSTWRSAPQLLAVIRDQQLASETTIANFAYATNADHGAADNIHPPYKQYPGTRLGNAALSMVYAKKINWRSPRYASAKQTGPGQVRVTLADVQAGLVMNTAPNSNALPHCDAWNAATPRTCAWAELQFNDELKSWVNATVSLTSDKVGMVLSAPVPHGATEVSLPPMDGVRYP